MKLLFILLSCCLLFACTITKRHFGAGYHVEWKKSLDKKKTGENQQGKFPLETSELKDSSEKIEFPESIVLVQEIPLEVINENPISSIDDENAGRAIETRSWDEMHHVSTERKRQKITNLSTQDLDQPALEVKKKTEPLTWISVGIFIGLGISISLIVVFGSFLYMGTGVFIFGLVLVLFICSLISFIRVSRHPDRYENKGLTRFMFALSMVCLTVAALYFLYVVGVLSFSKPMLQGI